MFRVRQRVTQLNIKTELDTLSSLISTHFHPARGNYFPTVLLSAKCTRISFVSACVHVHTHETPHAARLPSAAEASPVESDYLSFKRLFSAHVPKVFLCMCLIKQRKSPHLPSDPTTLSGIFFCLWPTVKKKKREANTVAHREDMNGLPVVYWRIRILWKIQIPLRGLVAPVWHKLLLWHQSTTFFSFTSSCPLKFHLIWVHLISRSTVGPRLIFH